MNAEVKLLCCNQKVDRLQRRQHIHQLPDRANPQLIRVYENAGEGSHAILDRPIHDRPIPVLVRPTSPARHPHERMVRHVLLQARHPARELVLLPNRLALEGVDLAQLVSRELGQVPPPHALQELGQLGLQLRAAERVDESDRHGGAAPGDPEERVLERGAPSRGEEGRGVLLGQKGPFLAVVLVMLKGLGDDASKGSLVLACRLEELLQVLFLDLEPALVAFVESVLLLPGGHCVIIIFYAVAVGCDQGGEIYEEKEKGPLLRLVILLFSFCLTGLRNAIYVLVCV